MSILLIIPFLKVLYVLILISFNIKYNITFIFQIKKKKGNRCISLMYRERLVRSSPQIQRNRCSHRIVNLPHRI